MEDKEVIKKLLRQNGGNCHHLNCNNNDKSNVIREVKSLYKSSALL